MTSDLISQVFSEALKAAIPAPGLTVSAWADNYRYLSPERSARPGRWSTDLVPFTRDIMDAGSDPSVREIVVVKANQVAGTECILNMIGFSIHIDPSTQLYACEDEKKADAWSKEALAPMIRDTPVLRSLVRESRERDSDNTIKAKSYPGGQLATGWATSPSTASSRPRRKVYLDERDAYMPTKEGDYCELAALRTDTYQDTKLIVKVSTPRERLENPPGTPLDAPRFSPIEREYHESDRRKYFVPCLHCETFQTLKWSHVKWDEEPLLAYYVCEHCGAVLEDEDKAEMLAGGKWIAEAEFRGRAGFHINKLYSPFVTWGEVADAFLRAKRSGDINQLRVWMNTSLAEGWQPPEEKIQTSEIEDRREDYGGPDGVIPIAVCLVTAGVDLQPDRIELEIVGWGLDNESWSIDYLILFGDPAGSEVWERLKERLGTEYNRADGVKLPISCTAIDSGGHHTNEAYRFAYENRGRRVFVVKGASTPGKPLISKPTIAGRPPVKLFILGTEAAKDTFFANLRLENEGPGFCHFPMERAGEQGARYYDSDYFKQLLSERPLLRKGRRIYVKIREAARNEALDNRVYAMAAYAILNPDMKKLQRRLLQEKKPKPAEPDQAGGDDDGGEQGPPVPPTKRPPFSRVPRSRGGFVNRWR